MIASNARVLVRAYGSGVHAGVLLDRSPQHPGVVTLAKSRRAWRWGVDGQDMCTCSELANVGPSKKSRITVEVPMIVLTDAMELHRLTAVAAAQFDETGWENESPIEYEFTTVADGVVGEQCVIRTYGAGTFAGIVEEWGAENASVVALRDARRIYSWQSDGMQREIRSLSEIAMFGVGAGSKIARPVAETELMSVIEIIPMSPAAIANLASHMGSR